MSSLYDDQVIVKEDTFTHADWNDLTKLFNEQLRDDDEWFAPSTYRKRYVEGKAWKTEVFDHLKDDEVISELDIKQRELQKERYKLQATKVELSRNLRHESRFDLLYENIRNAIQTLPLPNFEQINSSTRTCREYVVAFSDIHYGSNFKSNSNFYSCNICKHRFSVLLSTLIDIIKENNIYKLKIVNIADSIQGILRLSDLQMNEIAVVDAVVEISRLIAEFLNQLSAVCDIEYYHITAANHSQTRNLGSKASELATEDMERIILNYISDLLSNNERVTIIGDLDKEYLVIDIFDYKAIALHGHQIKNVQSAIKDLSNLHRTLYSYAFLGHRHTSNEITVGEDGRKNVEILNCPSFIGSSPYSDKLLVGSKAAAKVYTFDNEFGHIESKTIILN